MAERPKYYLFREYSRAVKAFLQETCYLERYPKDENVLVSYLIPRRAFAKIIVPIINGGPARPTVAFHLSGYEFATGENHLGFVKEVNTNTGDSGSVYLVNPPLIYRLTYSLQLYTQLQSDMDILLYQILSIASPPRKAVKFVEEQWAEIRAGNPNDETSLEPVDAQDKVIRFGLDLTIPRAYLPKGRQTIESILSTDFTDIEVYGDTGEYLSDIGDSEYLGKNIVIGEV